MLVELTVFAADAVATARLLLVHDRLSDFLANGGPIDVRGAQVTALATGKRATIDALQIDQSVMQAVATGEPRGNVARRLGTVVHPATAIVGPYLIDGELHGPPSVDAFEAARRRGWVPLTNATVAYVLAGREARLVSPVVLVNQRFLESLVADDVGRRVDATASARGAWPTDLDVSSAWR
jgi:hypothetical protein